MARPLRIEYAGAVYHVTSRGNEKKPVFKNDQDRENFLNTVQHVNKRYNWICHAYCLMTNHYHLLIETPEGNLSLGMRQLNSVYTQLFNKYHGRSGHLFQGRYKAILIQKDSHLLEVCRYVVLNPVRARMVEAPEGWKWSSYLATAGKAESHPCLTKDWVLGQFSRKRDKAEKEYRQFVQWGIDIPEIPRSQRYSTRPSLAVLLPDSVMNNHRKLMKKVSEAVEKYGYHQSELARHVAVHYSTISRWLREYENATKKT